MTGATRPCLGPKEQDAGHPKSVIFLGNQVDTTANGERCSQILAFNKILARL